MIEATLFLPISDRDHIFPEWEDVVTNLILPKDRMKVILSDATGGSAVGKRAEQIVNSLGFKSVQICRFKQRPITNVRKLWGNYLNVGEKCGETYDNGLPEIEGSLFFCMEDDIITPPDTFQILLEQFINTPDIGMLSGCTYKKKTRNTTDIIGWDINADQMEITEKSESMIPCKAVPTGCFITYSNIIKHFHMKDSVLDLDASPDITYCRYVINYHKLKVFTSTKVKTKHIYKRQGKKHIIGKLESVATEFEFPSVFPNYTSTPFKKRTKNAPVFIISFTGRAGSTLLQRVLSSAKDVMIWGEPQGAVNHILNFSTRMTETKKLNVVYTGNDQFKKFGYKGWISNVSPSKNQTQIKQTKALMDLHFDTGEYPVWGIKVINWNPKQVCRLHHMYPDASFIFLHRNMKDVEVSYRRKKNWWPKGTFPKWQKRYALLTEYIKSLPQTMHSIIIDFDVHKPDLNNLCDILENELQIMPLDRKLLDVHISSFRDTNKVYG